MFFFFDRLNLTLPTQKYVLLLVKYYYNLQFKIQLKIIYYPTIQIT